MRVRNLPLEDGIYSPNLVEITAIVGITAGAVLVLTVLLSVFRSVDRKDDLKANSIADVRSGASFF
jgi:Ni/Fe-hydrogenase subunit HybB-like protein